MTNGNHTPEPIKCYNNDECKRLTSLPSPYTECIYGYCKCIILGAVFTIYKGEEMKCNSKNAYIENPIKYLSTSTDSISTLSSNDKTTFQPNNSDLRSPEIMMIVMAMTMISLIFFFGYSILRLLISRSPGSTSPKPKKTRWKLDANSFEFMEKLGTGNFAIVYKAMYKDINLEVAVKKLKPSATYKDEQDFNTEMKNLINCKHSQIITFYGAVEESCEKWMIFEYMEYGDLAKLLRNSRPGNPTTNHSPVLLEENFIPIAYQIAEGMKYLASRKIIHRDLACRNCLVGANLLVKISDFGLSRVINNCYKIGFESVTHVRWTSPESLESGIFTLQSDLWSFGVVLWEIYNFGEEPYKSFRNIDVYELVISKREENLLKIPEDCPVQQIMQSCWKFDPMERMPFSDICNYLLRLDNFCDRRHMRPIANHDTTSSDGEDYSIQNVLYDRDHSVITMEKDYVDHDTLLDQTINR